VFDNIGTDLDEEANKRSAMSLLITAMGLGGIGAFTFAVGLYTAAEVLLDEDWQEDMMEVLLDDAFDDAAPPPPPPPPPPPAAAADEEEDEEEEEEEDPDDLIDEPTELKDEVKDEIKSDDKPKGAEGGVEGGVVGGVVGGVLGGIEGGVLGGQLGGMRVFHHSELEVKKRVNPTYPDSAKQLNLGDQRCLATVRIGETGVPYEVTIAKCPETFHSATKQALLKWRWYPPKDGKSKVKAQTTIAFTYVMK